MVVLARAAPKASSANLWTAENAKEAVTRLQAQSKNIRILTWNLSRNLASTAILTRPMSAVHGTSTPRGMVLVHTGHVWSRYNLADPDPDRIVALLSSLRFDVITLCMPGHGYNFAGESDPHAKFEASERDGEFVMYYFIAPVLYAIDWAAAELGYREFAMLGNGSGAIITQIAAAIEARITVSALWGLSYPQHILDTFYWMQHDYESLRNVFIFVHVGAFWHRRLNASKASKRPHLPPIRSSTNPGNLSMPFFKNGSPTTK